MTPIFMHPKSSFSFKWFAKFHAMKLQTLLATNIFCNINQLALMKNFFVKLYLNNVDCFDMIYNIHFVTMINLLKSNTNEKYIYLIKQNSSDVYESGRMNQTIRAQKYQVFVLPFLKTSVHTSFTK